MSVEIIHRDGPPPRRMQHATAGSTLADVLERVLDKGIVITGDIKIKLVDVELLTIQLRLVVASVDKARELGIDWWSGNPEFSSPSSQLARDLEMKALQDRIDWLERRLVAPPSAGVADDAEPVQPADSVQRADRSG